MANEGAEQRSTFFRGAGIDDRSGLAFRGTDKPALLDLEPLGGAAVAVLLAVPWALFSGAEGALDSQANRQPTKRRKARVIA